MYTCLKYILTLFRAFVISYAIINEINKQIAHYQKLIEDVLEFPKPFKYF